jgi:hypothetical protein
MGFAALYPSYISIKCERSLVERAVRIGGYQDIV